MKRPSTETTKKPKLKLSSLSKKDADIYQYENDKIRNEKNRAGDLSDDSDGELKGEDESIDDDGSEVGWDSDDELAYGHLFKNKKNNKSSSSSAQDDDPESDQEEAFEGEILLSDLFTSNKVAAATSDSKAKPMKHTDPENFEFNNEISEDSDSEYDVDNDEVEKGSQDEMENSSEEEDEEEVEAYSEDDNDDNDEEEEEAHNRLINAIDKFSKTQEGETRSKRKKISNQSAQESVFSTIADDEAVSMDALLGALGEVKGLNIVKKQLIDLEKGTSIPSYVEKVVAERLERSLAYDGTSEEMGKWQETVITNRHARTLDLAQDKRQVLNYKDLVKKFKPTTDMEREVQMILVKTGATDAQAEAREEDELGSRNFSEEEMKERQAELSKVKALMFYEQMKRHRLNKIKSKAYRRIRKRQKSKLESDEKEEMAENDPEMAREEEEKEALRRVKERMDMKHKNTGKWARMALQHGHHDESLRLAYHESVQLGHELSKRINDDPSSNRRGDDDSSDDDDDFQTDSGGKKQTASTRAAKEMLNVLEGSEDQPEATGKYKKLFEMDFMKKASDQKKERAREEALNILREIQEMEIDSDDEKKDESIGKKSLKDSTAFIAAKEQMKLQLVQGSAGMTLRGASKKVSVSGPISIKTDNIATKRHEAEGGDNTVRWMPKVEDAVTDVTAAAEDDQNPWLAAPTVGKKRDSNGQQVTHSNSTEGKSKGKGKGDGEKLYVKVQDIKTSAIGKTEQISSSITEGKEVVMESMKKGAAAQKRSASSSVVANAEKKIKTGLNKSAVNSSSEATSPAAAQIPAPTAVGKQGVQKERKPLLMQKSQEDLVQMAFAGPDLEMDFEGLKDHAVDEELGINVKRNKILSQVKAGWGDWAGPGAAGVSTKILNIRDRLLKKVEEETNEKKKGRKDAKMPNVMISDRRVKTAAKYKISDIPHPFTSREEYERSMQMPLGSEWNASNVVKATSVPDILLRAGRIVQPLVIPKGANNIAAPKKIPEEGVSEKKKMQRTITGNKKHKK